MEGEAKIPVFKFEALVRMSPDAVYCGILKREYARRKFTIAEWKAVLKMVKERTV